MPQLTLDLARFSLVTGLIALAGVGVTACLRTPLDRATRLLMGPAFGQALWAIALGSGVAMGMPVGTFAHGLWGATVLLAVVGGWQLRASANAPARSEVSRPAPLLHACVWLLPVLVMGPYFWHRLAEYPGSGLPDGWAYAAYGQYLWDFANGTEGGLAPLYQYASTLSSTRTIASAQLGVLALLNQPGDAQTGFGLLQAVGLASYAAAAAAFCRRSERGLVATIITVAVTVLSGWVLDVVWANNLDNLLALVYAPALAFMALWPRPDATGWWLGSAWLAAGLLHTYPEMGVAVLACAALSSGTIMASSKGAGARRRWIGPAIGAAVLLVVLMPSIGGLVTLLERQGQAASAIGEPRPGEGMFLGLVTPRHVLAGWWALGSEHGYERLLAARTIVAVALSVLLVAGIQRTVREKRTAMLMWLALPIGLAPFLALVQGYGYGAYKAILMGWWFQVFLVVHGAMALASARRRLALVTIVWLAVAALPGAAAARLLFAPVSRSFRMPRPASMAVFRQVRDVAVLVGSSPVLIAVQDEEASEWAVYYLRNVTTTVLTRDRYMRPKAAAMGRSQPVDMQTIRWVLADATLPSGVGTNWSRRWSGGPYALWETPPGGGRLLEPIFANSQ
ncbi:MAG: hypothetical protein ABMA15_02480 [Vicinamibacterales bacterium]